VRTLAGIVGLLLLVALVAVVAVMSPSGGIDFDAECVSVLDLEAPAVFADAGGECNPRADLPAYDASSVLARGNDEHVRRYLELAKADTSCVTGLRVVPSEDNYRACTFNRHVNANHGRFSGDWI
jgi:hypothetical protein